MGRDICFGAKVQVKSQDDTERTTSKIPSKPDHFAAKRRKVNKPLQKSLIKSNLSILFVVASRTHISGCNFIPNY